MRYIKSMTQQKLSFLLAIYIGLFMNCAVFFRRFSGYAHEFTVWKGLSAVVELAGTVLVTFFLHGCCKRGGTALTDTPFREKHEGWTDA